MNSAALNPILYKKLGYRFSNEQLLEAALTHRSVRANNNERLEFLGDSIINFLIAEELYQRCPYAKEGELSRLRATLVKGDALAELARKLNLGTHIHLGSGELKSGGFKRSSILADTLEALVAAIYLDSDMETCREHVIHWYEDYLNDLSTLSAEKDPKTRLQEYLQSKRSELPQYHVISVEGEAHRQSFIVECYVVSQDKRVQGRGSSRRRAEQDAATKMLEIIE